MTDALMLLIAWAAGIALGAMFFGGLWWTVQNGLFVRLPAFWFVASRLLRTAIALGGFYFIGRDDWQRLVICLLGFVMARSVVTWLSRPTAEVDRAPYTR
jgi:F1F0 ATPase subunit 2